MQKYLIQTSVAFQAASLIAFMVSGTVQAALVFIASSILFGFLCWLERKVKSEIEELRSEMAIIRTQMSNVAVQLGWNG